MPVDWIVEFTRGLFSLVDAAEVSECTITDEGMKNRAMMHDDREGITIFSPRHGRFSHLRMEVTDDRPSMSFERWDHVVELSLCTLSGAVEISTTCGTSVYDPATLEQIPSELEIEPGIYQLYVLFANLSAMQNRLREANETDYTNLYYGGSTMPDREPLLSYDHYRIILWPLREKVVKRFEEGSTP